MAAEVLDLTQDADYSMAITSFSYTYQCVPSPSPVFRTVQAEVAHKDGSGATSYLSQEEDAGVPRSCSGSQQFARICEDSKEYACGNEDLVLPQKASQ